MGKLRSLYVSRFCPDRTRTDPYTGLPWYLSQKTEMIGIWGKSNKTVPFYRNCLEIIEIDPRWQGLLKAIISTMRLIKKRNNFDIILCGVDEYSLCISLLVSTRTKTPVFSIVEDPPFTSRFEPPINSVLKIEKKVRKVLISKLLKKCSGIFCFIEKEVLKGIDVKNIKIYQLSNGAAPDGIEWKKGYSVVKSTEKKYIVGYIGEINMDQGVEDLLEIFAKARSKNEGMYLRLIGPVNKKYRRNFENNIAYWNLNNYVENTGWLPYEKMLEKLEECDVCVYCNKATDWFQAAHPLKICEYLALKKPIVAWDYPGIRRMLDNGKYGILIPSGEKETFTKHLINMGNPMNRKALEEEISKAIQGRLSSDYWYNHIFRILEKTRDGEIIS